MSSVQQCLSSSMVCTLRVISLRTLAWPRCDLDGDLFLGMDEGQGSMLVLPNMLVSLTVLIKEFFEHHQELSKKG